MAQHKHLFVMDPEEKLNLKLDSSLRLAKALLTRGHLCFMATPEELSLLHCNGQSRVQAKARPLVQSDGDVPIIGDPSHIDTVEFSCIHMRKDPPFDMDYITCTWLLSEAQKGSVILNDPNSLRSLNEKLLIFDFPQYCASGLLSSSSEEIITFITNECHGDAIIKPLDLYGGRGVQRLQLKEQSTKHLRQILDEETRMGMSKRLIQPFNQDIFKGEVRAFTAFGEDLSWCLKLPEEGEYIANTRKGAKLLPYQPSKQEKDMVRSVSRSLRDKGIELVGYDIIGGVISEINITSPRLLVGEGESSQAAYQRMAELAEQNLPT